MEQYANFIRLSGLSGLQEPHHRIEELASTTSEALETTQSEGSSGQNDLKSSPKASGQPRGSKAGQVRLLRVL